MPVLQFAFFKTNNALVEDSVILQRKLSALIIGRFMPSILKILALNSIK
jgi:hypothetical protein